MNTRDADFERTRDLELKISRQAAFASGLFQGDVTVRTLLESLPAGIVIIDSSGTILVVNNRAEQIFGYAGKDLIGSPLAVLIPERFRKIHEEHLAHFFEEPKIRPMGQLLDLVGLRQDASEFPLEIGLSFIETVYGTFFLAFVCDVTLRKEFEAGLRETEELFHIHVEKLRDYAIFTLDLQGNVHSWNAGAERMEGYRGEEIIGRHFSCFYPEEDRNAGKPEEELKRAAACGQVVDEGWRLRKDGSRFWAEVNIAALHDEHGNLWRFSNVTHDVTERKLEEIESNRHRILLEEAEKLAGVGAWEWDIMENRFHMSQEWLRIHGSDDPNPSREALMQVAHPEDRDAIAHAFNESIEKGIPYEIVHRIVRPCDGEVRVIQAYGYATKDSSGTPIRMYGAAQDITERRRAEDALRESECRYSALFASKINGIAHCRVITDEQGRPVDYLILQVNEAYEQIVGIKKADIEGRRVRVVFPGVETFAFDYIGVLGKIALEGGDTKFEAFLEPTQQYLSIYAYSPLPGEFTAILTDVTERRRSEETLREREAELARAQAMAHVGSWSWDVETNRGRWSDEACRIYGVDLNDFDNALERVSALVHPDDLWKHEHAVKESLAGRIYEPVQYRVVRPDGTERVVEIVGTQLDFGADGGTKRVFGVVQDITERKNAEEALLQKQQQLEELNRTLEQRVADAVADSRQKDQILILQGRQAAMGEMIGNVAHQWRQPLNMLGLIVQELQITYGRHEFSKESLEAGVKKAMALINHMSKTIDDFSNYFKPDMGKILFNVNKAVAMTLSLVEPGMKKLYISINVTEKDDIEISGYANEYSQVLLNILLNCRDAFEERRIDRERVIEIALFKGEDNRSVVTIADNAGGIPADVIDKIFDPYFTTKGPDKGTGIGLFMAKTIIEKNMRGKLTAHNTKDGAEFRIEV